MSFGSVTKLPDRRIVPKLGPVNVTEKRILLARVRLGKLLVI